jgi:hypothetical protein
MLCETRRVVRHCSPLLIEALEKSLREQPNDLLLRAKLLWFYHMNSIDDPSQMKFARHLLWLVKNFPEHADIFASLMLTPSCFEAVTCEWENQIAKNPGNVQILKNAAHFFCYGTQDFVRAEKYYLECISLAAANFKIQEGVSDFYSHAGQIESDILSLEKAIIYSNQAIALASDEQQKCRLRPRIAELTRISEVMRSMAKQH